MEGKKKLSNSDLLKVNAGITDTFTTMKCDNCQFSICWYGDYYNGKLCNVMYKCPECNKKAFHGVSIDYYAAPGEK